MELVGFLIGLVMTLLCVAGLLWAFVVLPLRVVRGASRAAKTAVLGKGYNLSEADRLRLLRDQQHGYLQSQIDGATQRAQMEAEAARQAALRRAQGVQQTQSKWV